MKFVREKSHRYEKKSCLFELFLFVSILLAASIVLAKATYLAPCEVKDGDIVYRAQEIYSDGGVVSAYDSVTGKKLWSQRVYGIEFSGSIEEDCEWVRITKMSLTNGILIVENSRNHLFELDLRTRQVKSRNDDMLAVELPGALTDFPLSGLRPGQNNPAFRQIAVEYLLLRCPKEISWKFAKNGLPETDLLGTGGYEILSHPKVVVRNGEQRNFKSVSDYPVQSLVKFNALSTNAVAHRVQTQFSEQETYGVGTTLSCHASYFYPDRETVRLMVSLVYRGRPRMEKTASVAGQGSNSAGLGFDVLAPSFPTYEFSSGEIKVTRGEYQWLGSLPAVGNEKEEVSLFVRWTDVGEE